ncbi:response regulator transcription factor [Solwaraspora sp. WMMD1047]|uniref:response regulator transcription factor n=1 Tax=Solwaraspora sp. WMMD1047 TaxID=3016102 RepID=UPI0024161870|nr:response regulator transcription factor [Solwaraspora sp. WMMD1047]MDG4832075.1 response regulator transcription factor [Solwaraspora sp. WMMD1047]
MARLLLIEDDPAIRTPLLRALRERGHAVAAAHTAMAGLQSVLDDRPDLVVLDLGLPDLDGLELLRMIRAVTAVPVIIATARDDETEIVRGLDAGGDDYVVKPFTAAQLDARIRAVLRRGPAAGGTDSALVVGELRVDVGARRATLAGVELELTPREFDLLHHLAGRADQVVTKRELLTEVWQVPYGGADKTVDVHLSWLRRKLGETAQQPRYLHTVRGVGVRLSAPPTGVSGAGTDGAGPTSGAADGGGGVGGP